jgi:hypothetical protein
MSVYSCDYGDCPISNKSFRFYRYIHHLFNEHGLTLDEIARKWDDETPESIRAIIKKIDEINEIEQDED